MNRADASSTKLRMKPANVLLPTGTTVLILNIKSMPELNGVCGVVKSYDEARGRFIVQASSSEKDSTLSVQLQCFSRRTR